MSCDCASFAPFAGVLLSGDNIIAWVRGQILANIRVVKYGIVGLFGVAINLATMAMLITMTSQRGWVPSTLANVVSTITNFILHNLWTFSDRQHQGARLVRGFLSFVVTSVLGYRRYYSRISWIYPSDGSPGYREFSPWRVVRCPQLSVCGDSYRSVRKLYVKS